MGQAVPGMLPRRGTAPPPSPAVHVTLGPGESRGPWALVFPCEVWCPWHSVAGSVKQGDSGRTAHSACPLWCLWPNLSWGSRTQVCHCVGVPYASSLPGAVHVRSSRGRHPSSLLWFDPGVPKYRQAKSREEGLSFVEHLLCARPSTLTPDQRSSG